MDDWVRTLIALTVTGLVLWGIVRAAWPRALFAVRVVNGQPRVVSGYVSAPFLARLRELADEHNVRLGLVWGNATRDGRIRLFVTGHFPPAAHQQLRNWWAEHGWPAPRSNGRR